MAETLRLIEIKRPKVVICLGMETYAALISAYGENAEVIRDISQNFWKSLEKGTNYKKIETYKFRIYGVSHAGTYGAVNRKKYSSEKGKERTGEELMISDWKRIGEYLKNI